MKNKKGKAIGILPVLIIAALFVAAALTAVFFISQSQLDRDIADPLACGDSTGKITISDYSAIVGGTDPGSPAYTASINDGVFATSVTSGTTTFPIGSKVEILASITDYLDTVVVVEELPCGGITIEAPMYYSTSDNPGIKIKNDDGDFMTDEGGATNQTALPVNPSPMLVILKSQKALKFFFGNFKFITIHCF